MESFFGIGLPELILILLIAGIVMGPERIGVTARWLGKTTSQLQVIARGFVKQLNAELDGIQDADEIRGAMQDMQDLRSQLEELKNELISVSNGATREGQQAVAKIQDEVQRATALPQKRDEGAVPPTCTSLKPLSSDDLPRRLEIPDDPEV
jgi:Sec-independent protein translocase protein TatA